MSANLSPSELADIILAAPEITLEHMLQARDERARLQRAMLANNACPLVSLTLNIPGSRKAHALAREAFAIAKATLLARLAAAGMAVREARELDAPTGFESLYAVEGDAAALKRLAVAIEDAHPLGRLFDIDVLDADGTARRGDDSGRSERPCLVCGGPVWNCARSRAHPAEQLALKAAELIHNHLADRYADHVASMATKALLYEAAVTPKPGLVDRANNGAHRDMDIFTFLGSASVLPAYFADMVRRGMAFEGAASDMLPSLRLPGQWAEERMFAATNGVNTHKGAIFSLGLMCAALGHIRAEEETPTEEKLFSTCQAIAANIPAELSDMEAATTHGRTAHSRYGIRGARGEAAAGYPRVRRCGLPALRRMLERGLSHNDAGVVALLSLMARVEDTNIVARSDMAALSAIRNEVREIVDADATPGEMLRFARELDRRLTEKNISPGGSADLLALSFFVLFLEI